jgi:DNA-binding NarL/FixJ family response regulator
MLSMDIVPTTTLLVADEFPLIRDGISRLCEATGQYRIVARCTTGEEALLHLVESEPDLALIDCQLPLLPGLEAVRRARASQTRTRMILMATRGDRKMALESLRAGAAGFLLKSVDQNELLDALLRVRSGSIYISPQIEFEKLFFSAGSRAQPTDPIDLLSSREYQVFQLLVDGVRAKDIAKRLQLSPKTVDTYRASLMRKLDIHDVAGLVKYAIHREMTSSL